MLICLCIPLRASILGAAASVIGVLSSHSAPCICDGWQRLFPSHGSCVVEYVQERSQFLFLRLWSFGDWEINALPFFYLVFICVRYSRQSHAQDLLAAIIVGATGLAVGLIADAIGPVAILVQGQSWRWVWIAVFVGALLLPTTVLQIWQDKKFGPLCAVLLLLGLTLPSAKGMACVSFALILWLMRPRFPTRAVPVLRWTFLGLVLAIAVWVRRSCLGYRVVRDPQARRNDCCATARFFRTQDPGRTRCIADLVGIGKANRHARADATLFRPACPVSPCFTCRIQAISFAGICRGDQRVLRLGWRHSSDKHSSRRTPPRCGNVCLVYVAAAELFGSRSVRRRSLFARNVPGSSASFPSPSACHGRELEDTV